MADKHFKMLTVGFPIALCLVFVGWLMYRRAQPSPAGAAAHGVSSRPVQTSTRAPQPSGTDFDPMGLSRVNALLAERLWKLAYTSPAAESAPPAAASALDAAQVRIREAILFVLHADRLDPSYFPRRPALLPQLLRALDDPRATPDKLARIITHDPVLAADVLRIANSSFYRTSPVAVETIQRAVVACGVDALRGILATAMMRPVFRATRTNFPRLPRMLWDRTERAVRAAELHALKFNPEDRFEAQQAVLLGALGPLVVYSASLDVYSRHPKLEPSADLLVDLTTTLGPLMSQRVAREWQSSPRLTAALERGGHDSLSIALQAGELLGTLSFLESQTVVLPEESLELTAAAGLAGI